MWGCNNVFNFCDFDENKKLSTEKDHKLFLVRFYLNLYRKKCLGKISFVGGTNILPKGTPVELRLLFGKFDSKIKGKSMISNKKEYINGVRKIWKIYYYDCDILHKKRYDRYVNFINKNKMYYGKMIPLYDFETWKIFLKLNKKFKKWE